MRENAVNRTACALLLLLLPVFAAAESTLWTVTSDGGEMIYLGGSVHVLRESDYPLPPEFEAAYADADRLLLELDMSGVGDPELQKLMVEKGSYPPGESLTDELSERVYGRLAEYARQRGIPLASLNRMRPWLLTLMLTMMEMEAQGFSADSGLDLQLGRRAMADGKPIAGLESPLEQIEALAALDDGLGDVLVEDFLRQMRVLGETLDDLIAAWRDGDVERLDEFVTIEMQAASPQVYERLIVERNRRWLPAIEQALESGEKVLVVVGLAHLVGENNVRDLLASRGYRIEKLILHEGTP